MLRRLLRLCLFRFFEDSPAHHSVEESTGTERMMDTGMRTSQLDGLSLLSPCGRKISRTMPLFSGATHLHLLQNPTDKRPNPGTCQLAVRSFGHAKPMRATRKDQQLTVVARKLPPRFHKEGVIDKGIF